MGKEVERLTKPGYDVVKALIETGPPGLSKDALVAKSGHGDAVNILKRLAKQPLWQEVISLPGRTGRRYRIG
jgi:hypothetical protein